MKLCVCTLPNLKRINVFFCFHSRPIRLAFEPENVANVQREYNRVKDEIEAMLPFIFEEGVSITFDGWATMIDGKVLGFINQVLAMQNCPMCNASPSKMSMRDSTFDNLVDHPDVLRHGFSPLHFKIRGMEFLIHLGMHSRIKVARCPCSKVKGEKTPQQADRDERLEQIQKGLDDHLRIKVFRRDKMGGSTNSGPCAKRFFTGDPDVIAKILDIPSELFITLRDMGNAISSSFDVDPDEFEKLCERFHQCFFDNFQKPAEEAANRGRRAPRGRAPSRGRRGGRRAASGSTARATPHNQDQEDPDDPEPSSRRPTSQPPRGTTTTRGQPGGRRGTSVPAPQAPVQDESDEPTFRRTRPARSTAPRPQYAEPDSPTEMPDNPEEESNGRNSSSDDTDDLLDFFQIRRRGRQTSRGGAQRPPRREKEKAETWYMMASTIHKVYKHGSAIIRACNFPPGLLSEEPAEANNKKIRFFREKLSRKFSRKDTMTDLFHRLMYCSDPLMLQEVAPKRLRQRKKLPIHPSIASLLKHPEVDGQKSEPSPSVSRYCVYLHEKLLFENLEYEDDHGIDIHAEEDWVDEEDAFVENPGKVFWTRAAAPESQAPEDHGDSAKAPRAASPVQSKSQNTNAADDPKPSGSGLQKARKAPAPRKGKAKAKRVYRAIASSSDTESEQEEDKRMKNPPKKPRTFLRIDD